MTYILDKILVNFLAKPGHPSAGVPNNREKNDSLICTPTSHTHLPVQDSKESSSPFSLYKDHSNKCSLIKKVKITIFTTTYCG